jgi:ABC-type bacteriocin/lantibiotic exporter with double-glycine peptidase domain
VRLLNRVRAYDIATNMTASVVTRDEAPAENQQTVVARPSSAVVVRSAYKQYGQTAILKDLNLTIPTGKM